MYDILIKNAKLRKKDGLYSIAIKNGKIEKISQNLEESAEKVIDAQGKLVTESFVNPHLHLCKVYT
ncbi:MAG: cytosine deaminase, partial [Caldisericia bacterium]|nr:cytosine deaminase [Caldisericia bacterium]